jgi:hypothetical protein
VAGAAKVALMMGEVPVDLFIKVPGPLIESTDINSSFTILLSIIINKMFYSCKRRNER